VEESSNTIMNREKHRFHKSHNRSVKRNNYFNIKKIRKIEIGKTRIKHNITYEGN
jgi:hypothetical protein